MGDNEVFTSCLSHDSGIGLVFGYILTNRTPQLLEYRGASGEVQPRKIRVIEDHLSCYRPIHIDQIHNTVGQPRFTEDLHKHIR